MTESTHSSKDAPGAAGRDAGERETAEAGRRLQDLVHASTTVIERLDLEVVLRRIVEAGMRLVGARYGALGVISPEGGLERFIHVGVDRALAERIGHLPEGRGLLGAVITDRQPIRLDHLAGDPRFAGFPAHHPPMESFLGVPVRVRDAIYGNLYLADSENGTFSDGDQTLVVALAATAGIAIENARLYDQAKRRELWSATIADVMAAMLDVQGANVLDVIAERVAALIDADLVAVTVPHGEGELKITTVHGRGAEALRGMMYPLGDTLAGRALAERKAVSIRAQPAGAVLDSQPSLGPTVAIPLIAGDEAFGVLSISRRADGPGFTATDLDMAFAFAAQASVAMEVVRAREQRRRADTAADRARIARDLHDHVIQKLFGAGLALQAATGTADAATASTIDEQIDTIDAAIRDIRTIIFALSDSERTGSKRVRDRLLDVVAEVTGSWSTPPRISFAGPLDSLVSAPLADDLVGVLRELLTNVWKHAHASSTEIVVVAEDDEVSLVVSDNGLGITDPQRRSGLSNLSARASARGGEFTIVSAPASGTRVSWSAPIDHSPGPIDRDSEALP
ncbi:GAF domain-containing protein [Microbacterium rhizomatis]|nr:GAF domain-containing protein [Microbacterium rhizomatis]